MGCCDGGPPDQPVVLFDYDPSRAGSVPVRLLEGFTGVLQADGYSGYGQVCRANDITRIGCWDHARRKFVEASKAAPSSGKSKKTRTTKADVALGHINKLYAIERQLKDKGASIEERYRVRQELSLPQLDTLKAWLFADTSNGARASATCYSLIETAKATGLEPSVYIRYVLEHIATADTVEKLESLLPWNVPLQRSE